MNQRWVFLHPLNMSLEYFEFHDFLSFWTFLFLDMVSWQDHVVSLETVCKKLGKEIPKSTALTPRIILSCLAGAWIVLGCIFFVLFLKGYAWYLDSFQVGIRLLILVCGFFLLCALFRLVAYFEYRELWYFLSVELKKERGYE